MRLELQRPTRLLLPRAGPLDGHLRRLARLLQHRAGQLRPLVAVAVAAVLLVWPAEARRLQPLLLRPLAMVLGRQALLVLLLLALPVLLKLPLPVLLCGRPGRRVLRQGEGEPPVCLRADRTAPQLRGRRRSAAVVPAASQQLQLQLQLKALAIEQRKLAPVSILLPLQQPLLPPLQEELQTLRPLES